VRSEIDWIVGWLWVCYWSISFDWQVVVTHGVFKVFTGARAVSRQ